MNVEMENQRKFRAQFCSADIMCSFGDGYFSQRDTSFQPSGTVGRSEQLSMAFRLPYECKLTDELLADILNEHGRVC